MVDGVRGGCEFGILADMYSFAMAEAPSSHQLWALFAARRAIDDAAVALEDAGAALLPLIADSEWNSDGVRALHELLVDFKDRSLSELAQLGNRTWELASVERS